MEETKVSTITKEQLLANEWVETGDPVFPLEKVLTDREHEDYDPEDGDLKLVLHGMRNEWMFGLSLPDGGLVDINPASIEELNAFGDLILGYEPPF